MGIRLLTSIVKRTRVILVEEKISDCYLVIDGDNLFCYCCKIWDGDIGAEMGSDLALFAARLENFFKNLTRCGIKPLVFLETLGTGFDEKLLSYLDENAHVVGGAGRDAQWGSRGGPYRGRARRQPTYTSQQRGVRVPQLAPNPQRMDLLLRLLFSQVIRRLQIPLLRYGGDADPVTATVARTLGCAVLTEDCDFWLLDVPCVRLEGGDLLSRPPAISLRTRADHGGGGGGYHMPVQMFRPERFERHFGLKPGMVPLFAALAGMESYLPAEVCDQLVLKLLFPGNLLDFEKRLLGIMAWLSRQRSAEAATNLVLERLAAADRARVQRFLETLQGWRDGSGVPLHWIQEADAALGRLLTSVDSGVAALAVDIDDAPAAAAGGGGTEDGVPPAAATGDGGVQGDATPAAATGDGGVQGDATPAAGGGGHTAVKSAHVYLRPAVRRLLMRGLVPSRLLACTMAGRINWIMLPPTIEAAQLPAALHAAAPLLLEATQLLGAAAGVRLLCLRRGRELRLTAAWCPWQPPLLERLLLEPAEKRYQLLLSRLHVRPERLATVPTQLRVLVLTLLVWRRRAAVAISRRHVLAALVTWMMVAPPAVVTEALGTGANRVRGALNYLIRGQPGIEPHPTELHRFCEMQFTYITVTTLNEILDYPLVQQDADREISGPCTLNVASALVGGTASSGAVHESQNLGDVAVVGRRLEDLLQDIDVSDTIQQLADVVEAEAQATGESTGAVAVARWRRLGSADVAALHPDLRSLRRLVTVLNSAVAAGWRSVRAQLLQLSVATECGLYCLVSQLVGRAVTQPSQTALCSWACRHLMHLQAEVSNGVLTSFVPCLMSVILFKIRQCSEVVSVDPEALRSGRLPLLEPLAGQDRDLSRAAAPALGTFLALLLRAGIIDQPFVLFCMQLMLSSVEEARLRWVCDILDKCTFDPSTCAATPEPPTIVKIKGSLLPKGCDVIPPDEDDGDPLRVEWNPIPESHARPLDRADPPTFAWIRPARMLAYHQQSENKVTCHTLTTKLGTISRAEDPQLSHYLRWRVNNVCSGPTVKQQPQPGDEWMGPSVE